MIVEIKFDLFNGDDFQGLNYLIQILSYKQRYDLFVDWDQVKNTKLWAKLDSSDIENLACFFNSVINDGIEPKYVISGDSSNFNLEEAIRLFSQPVSIILENSLNDQYFLLAVIKHFDDTGKLSEHINQGWLQFENAGGCGNVENFINGKAQSFNYLANQYNKKNYDYLRCFVLLDSDKLHPTDTNKHQNILDFLKNDADIAHHVLNKKAMENYLPEDAIDIICNTTGQIQWLQAYNNLTEIQKDHLNIEKGFLKKIAGGRSVKDRGDLEQPIHNLYASISDEHYQAIGLGLKLTDFKKNFPKHFDHAQISKSNLSSRCGGEQEFKDIIAKISKLI